MISAEEGITIGQDGPRARPDLSITEESWKTGVAPKWSPDDDAEAALESLVTKPVLILIPPVKHRWLEIVTTSGHLVTVIEIISPTNKEGGREAYQRKRADLVRSGVSVVELDLLRAGRLLVDVPAEWSLRYLAENRPDYITCVSRGSVEDRREVYPTTLRERLPTIRVPLRPGERDIALDIQAAVNDAYDLGQYWKRDHHHEPLPPLSAEDHAWTDAILRENGFRA